MGSVEVVDLQDEVLLDSLQPLNGNALVRHPGDRSQVVLAAGEEQGKFTQRAWFLGVTTG